MIILSENGLNLVEQNSFQLKSLILPKFSVE